MSHNTCLRISLHLTALSWHCLHDTHECLQVLEGAYAKRGYRLSSGGGLEEEVGDVGGEGVLVHLV